MTDPAETGTAAPLSRFPALQSAEYRWFLLGGAVSYTGDWMDLVALNWLILELTDSPFALGLFNFFRSAPVLLLALPAGVIADRYRRKRLMLVTQTGAMLLTTLLTLFLFEGWTPPALIMAVAGLRGAFLAVDRSVRHALIPSLVSPTALTSAVALHSTIRNTSHIVGPAIAGILLGLTGVKGCLLINALSYLPVIAALIMIRERPITTPAASRTVRGDVREVLRYIRTTPIMLVLVTIAIVPTLFGQPYTTLMPIFARDLLRVGASGLGFLLSAAAAGSVVGALAVATRRHLRGAGRSLLLSTFLFGLSLSLFAFSTSFPLSLALLFAAGLLNQIFMTLNMTLLQATVPDALRGRVMGIYLLNRGLVPLGAFLVGSVASLTGTAVALALMGGACMLLIAAIAWRGPDLWRSPADLSSLGR